MIGKECPCQTTRLRLDENITKPFNKIVPVLVIGEYSATLNSTDNNMVQGSRGINAGFAWHTRFNITLQCNYKVIILWASPIM
jgi:hypothetical protein